MKCWRSYFPRLRISNALKFLPSLSTPLHADQPFARGVDGEFAEIADDPLAAQLLRYGRRGAGAAEKIGDRSPFSVEAATIRVE